MLLRWVRSLLLPTLYFQTTHRPLRGLWTLGPQINPKPSTLLFKPWLSTSRNLRKILVSNLFYSNFDFPWLIFDEDMIESNIWRQVPDAFFLHRVLTGKPRLTIFYLRNTEVPFIYAPNQTDIHMTIPLNFSVRMETHLTAFYQVNTYSNGCGFEMEIKTKWPILKCELTICHKHQTSLNQWTL